MQRPLLVGAAVAIPQVPAEAVLPVDPGPHRISRLPIGQTFRILQHADQCQHPRRNGRPAAARKRFRELGIPNMTPNSSRTRIAGQPSGNPARATRAVASGIGAAGNGLIDMVFHSSPPRI